jgi:fluoride exporter
MALTSIVQLAFIGVAGASGALSRYLLGRFVAERANTQFPLGTFIINISGAFVIGLLAGLAGHKALSPTLQLILATGFLGGYTTYSTMNWEGLQLARAGSTRNGMLYLGGSLLLGLIVAALGMALGGWL